MDASTYRSNMLWFSSRAFIFLAMMLKTFSDEDEEDTGVGFEPSGSVGFDPDSVSRRDDAEVSFFGFFSAGASFVRTP